MALTFVGLPIPGFHGRVQAGLPMLQTVRTKFAGIIGESEIVLGSGGRSLEVQLWLNSPAYGSASAVAAAMGQMDQNVGVNGDLVQTGNLNAVWRDCTFLGFVRSSDILPARGIGMADNSYFVEGTLHFYQLSVLP